MTNNCVIRLNSNCDRCFSALGVIIWAYQNRMLVMNPMLQLQCATPLPAAVRRRGRDVGRAHASAKLVRKLIGNVSIVCW